MKYYCLVTNNRRPANKLQTRIVEKLSVALHEKTTNDFPFVDQYVKGIVDAANAEFSSTIPVDLSNSYYREGIEKERVKTMYFSVEGRVESQFMQINFHPVRGEFVGKGGGQ